SSNNTATHTLTNAAGCDSIVTLDLTINNTTTAIDVVSACNMYTWIDGVTYTSSNNTATHTLTNAAGCDSIVTLNLTLNNTTAAIDVVTACDSYTWIDGITYTSSNNTATHTLNNTAGCDSIVLLDLTINNTTTAIDVITACNSYTWIDGITYTGSNNTATHTLTNAAGCDSIVTLDLTINNVATGTDIISACDMYTWIDGITYTSNNNTATHLLTSHTGCDSIITLDLTIISIDTTVAQTGGMLMANQAGAIYQWINNDDGTLISGATTQSFIPVENGNYAVQVSLGSCTKTLTFDNIVVFTNTEEILEEANINVYPNPTQNKVWIEIEAPYWQNELNVELFNAQGQLVRNLQVDSPLTELDVYDFAAGVYWIRISDGNKSWTRRLIKQ
ncbi:MAG: T9SS type A sorting domain-containing protein, partial [Saprospiraceae bacterium]|nr:T9SS type A sorting domain-containing protein [Saprospiraceae bacterium]